MPPSSAGDRVAYPNIGAEDPRAPPDLPPVRRLRELFVDVVADPPWPWLADARGLIAWLNTAAALSEAERAGLPLYGARPAIAWHAHDKAFVADQQGDFPFDVMRTVMVDEIERAIVPSWPAWARRSFTMKPRWGTSGRGRARGADGKPVPGAAAAVARMCEGGGVVVEPWVERVLDLSTLWRIDEHREPHLLGSTRQIVRGSGVYDGCE